MVAARPWRPASAASFSRMGRAPRLPGEMGVLEAARRGRSGCWCEVWVKAQKQGLSERTVKRAKKELGILSQKGLHNGMQLSWWLSPG